MIKNVDEIVAITREANTARKVKIHDTTMEFINTTIAGMIERAAKDCQWHVNVRVNQDFDRDLTKSVLEAAGYEVSIKGYDVRIDWMSKYFQKGLDK